MKEETTMKIFSPGGWSPQAKATVVTTVMVVVSLLALGLRHAVDVDRALQAIQAPPPRTPGGRSPADWNAEQRQAALTRELHDALMTASPLERQRSLLKMADGLESRDFPLALEALRGERMRWNGSNDVNALLLRAWAAVDGPAAVRWELSWAPMLGMGGYFSRHWIALGAWQALDPAGVERWLAGLSPEDAKTFEGARRVARGPQDKHEGQNSERVLQLSKQTPQEIWAAVQDLPVAERSQVSQDVALALAASGKLGTMQTWLYTLPSGDERDAAVLTLLNQPGGMSVRDKMSLYSINSWLAERVDAGLIYNWVIHREDESMLATLENMPGTPETRVQAIRDVIRGLDTSYDPERAMELMDRHPEAVTDDLLTGWLAKAGSGDDQPWEQVLAASGKIKDPKLREEQYQKLLAQWRKKDAAAAEKWERSR